MLKQMRLFPGDGQGRESSNPLMTFVQILDTTVMEPESILHTRCTPWVMAPGLMRSGRCCDPATYLIKVMSGARMNTSNGQLEKRSTHCGVSRAGVSVERSSK